MSVYRQSGRNPRRLGALLTRSAKGPGYQVTYFDAIGFSGDTTRDTAQEAERLLEREGYVKAAREFFDAVSQTEQWDDGMKAALKVQQFNERSMRMKWEKWFDEQVTAAADCGFNAMCRCLFEPVYLWYRPGGKQWGGLAASADSPGDEWEMVDAEPMPPHFPLSHLKMWVRDRSTRLPILGPCD